MQICAMDNKMDTHGLNSWIGKITTATATLTTRVRTAGPPMHSVTVALPMTKANARV